MSDVERVVIRHICEGQCIEHIGIVRKYHVYMTDPLHDWGCFYYCDEAADEDKSRGFNVDECDDA